MKKHIRRFILTLATLLASTSINSYSLASTELEPSKFSDINIGDVQKAAEKDEVHAQILLGMLYFTGEKVEQNYQEAKKWFERASEKNVSEATSLLGIMYLQGLGVEADEEKATMLFIKAKAMPSISG